MTTPFRALACAFGFLWIVASAGPVAQPAGPLVERVGDTGFLQLQAESFRQLDARQQALTIKIRKSAKSGPHWS